MKNGNTKRGRLEQFRGLVTLLRAAFANARWTTLGALILYPIARLESVVVALGLRWTIDAAIAGSGRGAILGIVTVVSGVSIMHIIDQIAWRLCLRLEEVVGHALDRRTAELVAGTPGIEHFERPEYLDRVEILREQGWMLGRYLYSLPMTWGDLARSAATIALLGTVHPILFLLPLFGIPALFTETRADLISRDAQEAIAEDLRRSRSIFELTVRPDAGKEIRIFRLADWLIDTHRRVWAAVRSTLSEARRRSTLLLSVGWLAFSCAFIAAVFYVTRLAIAGEATLGDLVLTLTLGVRVGGEVSGMAHEFTYLRRIARLGSHLSWIESYTRDAITAFRGSRIVRSIAKGISFKNVSFRYTGSERFVLRNLSFDLVPGTTVAIVGQNGAGKTTLIKLLSKMYNPTSGEILVDGIPLPEIDRDSWLAGITSAFQDFAKVETVVRETVGIGDVARVGDEAAVRGALVRGNAHEMVDRLPNGMETQLGGSWEGGHEPSIGQWQKLAIGRFAMREEPFLYILDEPTASLDPQTEHEVFERHREIVSRNRSGSITLLVSHRFSTVSTADAIIVLEDGVCIESGTHEELMRLDGYYARFYSIQKKAFDPDEC